MAELCIICTEKAKIKCSGCGQILYCSEDHKTSNARKHKTDCLPYSIETNSKYGRYLVTSRAVKQGELLLRERPLVVGPRVDSLPACLECQILLGDLPSRCSSCGVAQLCPRCVHNQLECLLYSSLSPANKTLCLQSSSQYVLPLRIILNLKSPDGDANYKKVLEMESHTKERKGTGVWWSHENNVVELLRKCGVISNSKEDSRLAQHVCGVLDVNSFEVRGAMGLAGRGMRLRGVYTDAAFMAHDCLGNVHLAVDDGFVMTIRACVDIPAGQPILYNYTDPLKTTQERQNHLREGKYFTCSCKRCGDPTELGTFMGAVRCSRCRKGFVTAAAAAAEWTCGRCDHRYLPGVMALTTSTARDRLDDIDRSDPQQLELALKQLDSTFHPTHSVMVDLKQSIVAAYRDRKPAKDNLQRQIDLCRELLPILRIIEPGVSRLRGITLYELHVSLVSLAQMPGGSAESLREAETVLKEAVALLLHEPTASPEGELARQAMAELRSLQNMIAKHDKKNKSKRKGKK